MDFKGKIALVSEGDKGIGKEVALALSSRGAKVIVSSDYINMARTIKNYNSIDILINYISARRQIEKSHKLNSSKKNLINPIEQYLAVDAELKNFHNYSKIIIPKMIKQGYGRIVNVADSPIQGYIKYMAIRDEITRFTKILGRELARKNIYMNSVIPGLIEGEDYTKIMEAYATELALYLPVQRPAKMEEVIEPILFLASDKVSYIFGETIRVDAGVIA
jgi:3-oxoacyl-[acyl-carrier protein] reductase